MKKSESIKELSSALAKAQGELKPLHKNTENPFFKSTYADLSESVEKILPVLSKHGLSVCQGGGTEGTGMWVIETMLMHSSGEWISFSWPVIIAKEKMGPQDFASSASYARRYAIQAITSAAASDDDDANKAEGKDKTTYKPPKAPTTTTVKNYAPGSEDIPLPSTEDELGFNQDPRSEALIDYKIDFGKYLGKTIREVGLDVCKNYAAWLRDSNTKSGKSMNDNVKLFCDHVASL